MSWICHSVPQPSIAVQTLLATEFRTLDPSTKQIYQEILRDETQ
jgi:hypothetical protein